MKLQQLRFLDQVVAQGCNVSAAAGVLHTSQSGISRQLRLLEAELGASLFVRGAGRLVSLTEVGAAIHAAARDVLLRAAELKTVAADFDRAAPRSLVVATTHLHARYRLIGAVSRFGASEPGVTLRLMQTFPAEIFEFVAAGGADIGLTTESPPDRDRFDIQPVYPVARAILAPHGHPLLARRRPTLADVARHSLVMHDVRLSSGREVMTAFTAAGLTPNVVLTAVDVDVIRAAVAGGLGVAIVPALACGGDESLRGRPCPHLFPDLIASVVLRRGRYLPRHIRAFIDQLAA